MSIVSTSAGSTAVTNGEWAPNFTFRVPRAPLRLRSRIGLCAIDGGVYATDATVNVRCVAPGPEMRGPELPEPPGPAGAWYQRWHRRPYW